MSSASNDDELDGLHEDGDLGDKHDDDIDPNSDLQQEEHDTQLHKHACGPPTCYTSYGLCGPHTSTDNVADESTQCLETSNCQSL